MIVAARRAIGLFGPADDLGAWIFAARLPAMLFGLLNVLVLWCWVRRAFDSRAAGIAAVFFAILPLFCENSADALSDAPHLFFYLLSAWLITEGMVRRRFWFFPVAGVSSGVAFWIRPEGLAPVVVGAGVIALLAVFRREKPLPALAWLAGLLVAAGNRRGAVSVPQGETDEQEGLQRARAQRMPPSRVRAAGSPPAPVRRRPLQSRVSTGTGPVVSPAAGADRRSADGPCCPWQCGESALLITVPGRDGSCFAGAPKAQPRPKLFLAALAGFNILLLLLLYLVAGYIAGRHTMPLLCVSLAWAGSGTIWLGGKLSGLLAPCRRWRRDSAPASWPACWSPGPCWGCCRAACARSTIIHGRCSRPRAGSATMRSPATRC